MSTTFDDRLAADDLSLFDRIESQSTSGDRYAWLALQRAARAAGPYSFLEIGSHLGGSIQPYLLDPQCRLIYSIDRRPEVQPDDRAKRAACHYHANSSATMMANLRGIDAAAAEKVTVFDMDARDVPRAAITDPPAVCFIDGEHTKEAVLSDFAFCRSVCRPDAVIYFHDDWIVYSALVEIARRLTADGVPHATAKLSGSTFAVILGDGPAAADADLRRISVPGRAGLRKVRLRRLVQRTVPRSLLPLARFVGKRLPV